MKIIYTLIFTFSLNLIFAQTKIGDVTLPNSLKAGSTNLVLNGGGIREKYFMDIYIGGLYLQSKNNQANTIIAEDKPMAIKLHMVSSLIDSKKMIEATNEGFNKSTGGIIEPIKSQIKMFIDVFNKEEIKVGDIYDLIYIPGTGVQVYKAQKLQTTITGIEFKKALFGIWLCNDPADSDLKTGMLGK